MAVAAAVTIGSTFIAVNEGRKREKRTIEAQKEAQEVERATQANQARLSRRKSVREARLKRSQIENLAISRGQETSSAAIAAGGSLQTQLGSNIGNLQDALAFADAGFTAQQNVFDASRKSGLEVLSGATAQFAGQLI